MSSDLTRAGVGAADDPDSFAAGAAAAREAIASGALDRVDFALLFATSRHDPRRLLDGVRRELGPAARVYGGNAVGVVTRDRLSYDGHEVALAAFRSDAVRLDAFLETGLAGAEESVGERLGARLAASGLSEAANLLLLYDTVDFRTGAPRLNMASPILRGMGRHLRDWPTVAGMGMIGDMQLNPTWQWFEDRPLQQGAMALALSGPLRMDVAIMHGCRPAGRYHEITRAEGPLVLEIDGRPALSVIHDLLGPDAGLSPEDYAFFVTLGVNRGDPYGPFREEDYANRMCIAVDASRGALVMFEDDLTAGMKVQLMRRSVDAVYVAERTRQLVRRAEGRRPVLALYIDCAGRAAAYCGADEEEAAQVQASLPASVPLLGVYSGVEIAKVGDSVQALDWTGVLCLFSE